MEKQTFSVPETARILGIGRHSAYQAVRCGAIPSLKIGKRILVPRQAVERMLAADRRPEAR